MPLIYRRTYIPMCEFNKDALQQKQGTASRKAIFKKYCLANAFIFCS